MGHLIRRVLPRVGNLTGKFIPMVGRFECAEYKTGTKFVLQLSCVGVSGECLFTTFSH